MARADGWPQSDVKADLELAPNSPEAPSQHGAAADKYYQLLSLHGDTVSSSLCCVDCRDLGMCGQAICKYRRQGVVPSRNFCSLLAQETCDGVSASPGCGT